MSEFTWYSRLAVWVGAAILFVQAVLGRGTSFITLIAVLLLSIGLVSFISGLVNDSDVGRKFFAAALSNSEPAPLESGPSGTVHHLPVDEPVTREKVPGKVDEP